VNNQIIIGRGYQRTSSVALGEINAPFTTVTNIYPIVRLIGEQVIAEVGVFTIPVPPSACLPSVTLLAATPPSPPAIAYGIRTIITGYTGPLIQLNGTDYYAVNPGVLNSPLDPAAPTTGNPIVNVWYDQGSMGLHLVPTSFEFSGDFLALTPNGFPGISPGDLSSYPPYINNSLFSMNGATVFVVRYQQ
jgi:hypothetical protein